MPGGDRTGPAGMGPMTGRAAGFCAGYPTPGYANPGWGGGYWGGGRGRGRGWGHGGGRGWGWGWRNRFDNPAPYAPAWQGPASYPAPVPREQELEALKAQAEYFERALEELRNRIKEVEKNAEGK